MLPLHIEKLKLKNFRNIDDQMFDFVDGINCIFGENGNGKTNILEAIYYLVKRKSFRKNTGFPQILSIDGENQEILFQSLFRGGGQDENLSLSGKVNQDGALWTLDGKNTKRKIDIGIVFINPFDSQSFHTSASFRRSWVDDHLSQLNSQYKKELSKFTKALRFRNKLLSTKPASFNKQIDAIDNEMAPLSLNLTSTRKAFLQEITPLVRGAFNELFSEDHNLEIQLDTKITDNDPKTYYDICQRNREKEAVIGYTMYGVHKDDYVLLFDGLNSFDYCSLGQQKMSYLSLLFAYIELFRYKFSSFPIVLIDDVSGELDKLRWRRLVNYLKKRNFQVFITTANDNFKEELDTIEGTNKIFVDSGSIKIF